MRRSRRCGATPSATGRHCTPGRTVQSRTDRRRGLVTGALLYCRCGVAARREVRKSQRRWGRPGMILSDRDILQEIEAGRIGIEPLERACIQPSSVDLHLGNQLLLFRNSHRPYIDVKQPIDELMESQEVAYGESFAVHPLEVLLAGTYESVTLPEDLVARLEGKSSLARLGLQ